MQKLNVLSLFDGMSCGQLALKKLGIEVENYYASEIDKYAMQVTKKNFPDTIHVGDVTKLRSESYVYGIDLLIGGSPCQGFSFAGKQLNFEDPRSKLFFEYVRLLKECKPKYFLLENVKMKKEYQDVISKELGVEPIEINSALLSAQNRKRLYWTNIPFKGDLTDRNIFLKDILEENPEKPTFMSDKFVNRFLSYGKRITDINSPKARNLSAREYEKNGRQGDYLACNLDGTPICLNIPEGELSIRKLTPIECERLQTVPDNYTEGVSNTQRYKMLGNGWTVDVIVELLRGIK